MPLVPLSQREVTIGAPLPFSVYTEEGRLLMGRGHSVQSAEQFERLFAFGAFRHMFPGEQRDDAKSAQEDSAPAPAARTRRGHDEQVIVGPFPTAGCVPEDFVIALASGAGMPARTRFVGMLEGASLLLDGAGVDPAFAPGEAVEGQFIAGRYRHAFQSDIVGRHAAPFDVLYLRYPAEVRSRALRRHIRVGIDVTARLSRNDRTMAGTEVRAVDLSAAGVGLLVNSNSPAPGEHFKLSLPLSREGRVRTAPLNCIARNRRTKGGETLVGAEFGNTSGEARALVNDFVLDVLTGAMPPERHASRDGRSA
ncbi:PilZ domain-containing protein [Paraburkholderia sp. LEh10]|uniref:PilZ domain-containing protein n=1 Tax=Paraburkholderia sp. LEh10 TaxID=2821353 RepID=UPI001AE3FF31|nr:PilZ domain-containing protein [Paraburkholderia sp. LEh10]MBP0588679.1 PilZ domain-containing protein [Paraburkholderia sp. LEh10]